MQKTRPTFQIGVCSFGCGDGKPQAVVQSIDGKTSICTKCLHDSTVAIEKRPVDSVVCLKCQSFAGFVASYPNPSTKATFQHIGNDKDGVAMYTLISTGKDWKSEIKPTGFNCSSCSFKIATWMVTSNSYLAPFFKNHKLVKKKKK